MCGKIALVVLLAFVSVAYSAPAPGFLGGYHGLPAATSYSSRIDIHGPEYVKTYAAAPVIKTVVAAPIVKTVLPAVSYHTEPLIGYSSYGYGLGHGYGLEHGYGLGHGYGYGHGLDYAGGYGHGLGGHYY